VCRPYAPLKRTKKVIYSLEPVASVFVFLSMLYFHFLLWGMTSMYPETGHALSWMNANMARRERAREREGENDMHASGC